MGGTAAKAVWVGIGIAVLAVTFRVGAGVLTKGAPSCRPGDDPPPPGAPQSPPAGQEGLWLVNSDGTKQTRVTTTRPAGFAEGWSHFSFAWSPDGKAIGYIDPNTKAGTVVAPDGAPLHGPAVPPGPYVMGRAWSPDARDLAEASFGLSIVMPGGSRRSVLQGGPDEQVRDPAWSPDGNRIAFAPNAGDGGIDVVNVDGTNRRVVVAGNGKHNMFGPAWSRDSRRLAFEAHGGYYGSFLGVVNSDGSGLRHIAKHCGGGGAAWSPDGRRIAFVGPWGLWVVDADGRHLTRLPETWYGGSPSWSPDGSRIAFVR